MRRLVALALLIAAATSAPRSADAARIRSVEPATASPGETITITGRGLSRVPVAVGEAEAIVVERGRRSLTVIVPHGAAAGPTEITVGHSKRRRPRGNAAAFCVRGAETCDGVDNDCNGAADDGIADVPVGVRGGTNTLVVLRCRGGRFVGDEEDVEAAPPPDPPLVGDCLPGAIEPCYDGPPETRGVGACQDGMRECSEDGVFGPCILQVLPGDEEPGNGIDENCDGRDGPGGGELCIPGAIQSCYSGPPATRGVGRCHAGARQCDQSGRYGLCEDQVLPGPEIPGNGIDENCDGLDEEASQQLEVVVDPALSPTFQASSVITGAVGFNLQPTTEPGERALIASLAPAEGHQGESLDVTITGDTTNFVAGLTQAAFGSGVVVNDVTVTGPTTAIAHLSIDPEASVGPRVVAVATSREEAFAANAFAVLPGLGSVSGRIVDDEGNAVAGAEVCTSDGSVCTTTGADGTFVLDGVPIDTSRIIVEAAGFDPFSLPVQVGIGADAGIGDLALAPPDEPPPPPLPNSPPVSGAVASFLGRGATRIREGGNPAVLQKLVRDTLVAVGGDQAGVIGPDGTQQNPLVEGDGVVTLSQRGVEDVADKLAAAEITTLGEVLRLFVLGFNYGGSEGPPRLVDVLAALQTQVNAAWADPAAPGAPLLFALFNDGFVASEEPPQVRPDTPLNTLQAYLLTTSLLTWVQELLDEGAAPPPAPLVARAATTSAPPRAESESTAESGAYSTTWATVFEHAAPFLGNQVSNRVTQLCQGATTVTIPACPADNPQGSLNCCGNRRLEPAIGEECDPPGDLCDGMCRFRLTPRPPGCKEAVQLVQILIANPESGRVAAGNRVADFFVKEGATRATADRLRQQFQNEAYQDAWAAARREAEHRGLAQAQRFVNIGRALATEFLTNVQGQLVDLIINLEIDLIIQSLRPNPPFIERAEQVIDADRGEPSNIVRIDFQRSPNDRGEDESSDNTWYYQLFRQQGATTVMVDSGQVRESGPGPRPNTEADDDRALVFYDYVPTEGSYIYRVLAKRLIGSIPFETPPDELDRLVSFIGGMVPLNFSTPGGTSLIGADTLKTILNPAATIMKGIKFQASDMSDPQPIYVRLGPPEPQPPANLVADPRSPDVFLSIPFIGRIFRANDGPLSLFADTNFKTPFQTGLAVDGAGNLYSDNAASDALFGGRVFQFAATDAARNLTGTVNKYSFLLGFARPVSVQAITVGPTPAGESLFIADTFNHQVKVLRLNVPFDRALNVAQPLVDFSFGPSVSMAVRSDGALVVSRFGELYIVDAGSNTAQPMFPEPGLSPFIDVSGVAFDRLGNLYVSDAQRGFIMTIPRGAQAVRATLAGYDDVERQKLKVLIGRPRPRDVQVASDQRSFAFFDAERVTSEGFGMSGQVTDASGDPLPNAQLTVEERAKVATTDGDGIFVMPGLTQAGDSQVVDVTIRHDGRTQTERVVLQAVGHSVRDFRFDPPGPPGGGGQPAVDQVGPRQPLEVETPPGANTVIGELPVEVPTVGPGDTPPADPPPFGIGVLDPVDGVRTPEGTTMVKGFVTDPAVTTADVVVNGERQTVDVTGGEFAVEVPLADGDNTIAVEAYDAGPGGQLGHIAAGVTEVESSFMALEEDMGGVAGRVAGSGGGGMGRLIQNIARIVPPEVSGVLNDVAGKAGGLLGPLRLGKLPTAALIADLQGSRSSLSSVTSGLGDSGMVAKMTGAVAQVVESALADITALQQTFATEAATTALRAVEVGTALDGIEALPPGTLPPSFTTVADSMFGQVQSLVGQLQVGEVSDLSSTATQICDLQDQMESLYGDMNALQQQQADGMMDAVRNMGSGGSPGPVSGCPGLSGTVNKVAGEFTKSFGGIANLAGETVQEAFSNMPDGLSVPADVLQSLSSFSDSLEPIMTDVQNGVVPADDSVTLTQQAADDVVAAVNSHGGSGGIFGGVTKLVSGIAGRVVPGLGGMLGTFANTTGQLSNPLSSLLTKVPDLLGLPPEQQPPSAPAVVGPLAQIAQRVLDDLGSRKLPALADPAQLQTVLGQTEELFKTVSEMTRVQHDVALGAIEHIIADTGEVADVAISGRVTDVDSGQPVAGFEIEVPGTAVRARTDTLGKFHVLLPSREIADLVAGVTPLIEQLNVDIGQALANAASGDRAGARSALSDLVLALTAIVEQIPQGLSQQAAVEASLNELNAQAGFSIATIDGGSDVPAEALTELNDTYLALAAQMQEMIETVSALLKSRHDSAMRVIAEIK